jgi:hypothetical protein
VDQALDAQESLLTGHPVEERPGEVPSDGV